ncbi:MAG: hypothetical protein BGO49_04425 [Planctomycetales bacterium 71-10]|nr:MAG: hypothetical protein BGO49_04425 [Planctomycetales bacterium 71-10]
MLRFELGSSIGVFLQVPATPTPEPEPIVTPPAPTKADVKPAIKGLGEGGVVLTYPSFDPAVQAAPAETRAYFVKPGEPVPTTVEAWLASDYPYSVRTDPVPPEGVDPYTLAIPSVLEVPGDYLVQTLLGYDDAAA